MRPSTRMMMISALGEDRKRMEQHGNEMRRGEYAEHEMHERTYPPHGRRYARHEEMPESRYEAHRDEDEPQETEGRRRRMRYESDDYEPTHSRRGGMYSGDHNPMGFDRQRRRRGGEEELSGNFRYYAHPRHVQEGDEEAEQQRPLSEERVKKWVKGMVNEDGTKGGHFSRDSAEVLRRTHCPKCDELEFFAAVNMIYSDYCKVAKELSVDKPEFYAFMAKAFLEDKDGGEDKLLKYMQHIAKK